MNLFSEEIGQEGSLRVLKRGGQSTQEFSLSKIESAVARAFNEVGSSVEPQFLVQLAKLVKAKIHLRFKNGESVPVESIQDFVETALMETGCTDVAKAYILYRSKHQELREKRLVPDPFAVANYIHPGKYSRYLADKQRREVYEETVARVEDMHVRRFPHVEDEIREVFDMVRAKKILPSMRSMQFAGEAIETTNARMFNCLGEETEFITSKGVRSFRDFEDGDEVKVLTHRGRWRNAVVRNFGKQKLYEVRIARGRSSYTVRATRDHRWILSDGSVTTDLSVGHKLYNPPTAIRSWVYEESTPEERWYWAMGYVYGDGTTVQDGNGVPTYSMVRLCGDDGKYLDRFKELGFSWSRPKSCNGDAIAYTGRYLKQTPSIEDDGFDNVVAFVRGYLDADGSKNSNFASGGPSEFSGIQSSSSGAQEFIYNTFPAVGAYITREYDLTGQATNFGIRPPTTYFGLVTGFADHRNSYFSVQDFKESSEEDVWCLVVEEDQSFVLPNGIVTGNCCFMHIDKPRAFGDALYLLLCGCGVGYSIQFDHVEKLPPLKHIDKRNVRHYTIPDSIEGWGNALTQLILSYVRGQYIEFNYSKIRPEGSPLKTSGGKAPGHIGLKTSLDAIRKILDEAQGRKLRPIECYDILCLAADAVLSGGIRRSATIALFSMEDGEMMAAKTGNWYVKYPWRANSNNSVVLKRGDVKKKHFKRVFNYIKEFGEPGFIFTDNYEYGFNPCQPASASVLTPTGLATLGDISVGDKIWSAEGWTTVVKKWSTGVKDVYKYRTSSGYFLGTENHRVVSEGVKVEVQDAESIDILSGPDAPKMSHDPTLVMDGLVLGDGLAKERCATRILCVGKNDQCYFSSEVAGLLGEQYDKAYTYKVTSSLSAEELPALPARRVPKRFMASYQTMASVLRGLYSANGSVVKQGTFSGRVTLKTTSRGLVDDVQIMLSALGIRSYFTTNKPKRVTFPNGEYECRESYDVNISTDRGKFLRTIGFIHPEKMAKLEETLETDSPFARKSAKKTFPVRDIEYVSTEEVFDITVDNGSHTYWTGGLNVSNCGEINLNPVLEVTEDVLEIVERKRAEGQSIPKVKLGDTFTGVAFCNLTEINAAAFKTPEDMYRAAVLAARLGTLQAAYTSFPYLGWVSEVIAEREALLGVSMTGMMDSPDLALNAEHQREAADRVVQENKRFAEKIGVRWAARSTCVKPAGTSSLELGCVGSGIHAHHARRYIRRVTANELEPVFQYFRSVNPHMCRKKPNGDFVIEFPVSAPEGAVVLEDLTALDFLATVRSTQENWVRPGTADPDRSPGACHNVSNTVVVREHEWEDVADYVWKHNKDFSGISFLPATGDKDYAFSPREAIVTEADEDRWNQLLRYYKPVDYSKMVELEDGTDLVGELACAGGSCEI